MTPPPNPRLRAPKAFFAYKGDPRFSYCLHLPRALLDSRDGFRLLVAVHGSSRGAMAYRDALAPFADAHRHVVLAPLFPVGVLGDDNVDGYKMLAEGDLRYDLILLGMIAEVEAMLRHEFGRFDLFGFSGGGQFAHRFFYLHADRLASVTVGAPGAMTILDDTRDYWVGTRDMAARFGRAIDLPAMRDVATQLIVGADDVAPLVYPAGAEHLRADVERLGSTRVERVAALADNWRDHGIAVEHHVVPGVAHKGLKMIPALEAFLARRG